jgi:hypothetical protein
METPFDFIVWKILGSLLKHNNFPSNRNVDKLCDSSIPLPNGLLKPTVRTTRTRRSAPKAAELVSVDAGHGEEEGSENDGKLGHHGAGCVTEQEIGYFVSYRVCVKCCKMPVAPRESSKFRRSYRLLLCPLLPCVDDDSLARSEQQHSTRQRLRSRRLHGSCSVGSYLLVFGCLKLFRLRLTWLWILRAKSFGSYLMVPVNSRVGLYSYMLPNCDGSSSIVQNDFTSTYRYL